MVIYTIPMAEQWSTTLRGTLHSSMVVLFGIAAANILNYIFTAFIGRTLGPEGYSVIATLLTLSLIINPLVVAAANFFSKFTTEYASLHQYRKTMNLFRRAMQSGVILGCVGGLAIWATADISGRILHIPSSYISLFAVVIGCTFPRAISLGIIQGLQRFRIYAGIIVSEIIIKLCIVVFFAQQELTAIATILAILCASIAVSAIATAIIHQYAKQQKLEHAKAIPSHEHHVTWLAHMNMFLLVSIGTALLIDVDMLFVKHYVDAEQAGLYAALMATSRMIYYSSLPFGIVLFPAIIKAHTKDKGSEKKIFEYGFIGIMAIAGSLALLLISFPERAITLLFGSQYTDISHYLYFTVPTVLGWIVTTTLSAYFIATERYKFGIAILTIAAFQVLGVFLFHETVEQIIQVIMGTSMLAAMTMASIYLRHQMQRRRATR